LIKRPKNKKYVVFDIESTGLLSWYGDRITCICAKDSDGNRLSMVDKNENSLIKSYLEWIKKRSPNNYFIITKNGKQFDIPFILARLALQKKPGFKEGLFILDYEHLDLHEITSKQISLQVMAELLNCTFKSGVGENAIKLWNEKRYDELKAYCMQDVETTEEVYLKWLSLHNGSIDEPEIWESEEIFHRL